MPKSEYVSDHQGLGNQAVALLAQLVSIDSVNPGLVAGAHGESVLIACLQKRLSGAGFDTHVITPPEHDNRPSLLAIPKNSRGKPVVVFNGHVDTVGVSGMDAPFTPRVVGDTMFGRGAADMKGGVAAMVVAAEELVRSESPWSPVLALVADEEDNSLGSAAVIADLERRGVSPRLCIIGEPSDLALTRSLRGFSVARVRFAGRAAHSSQPELGVNAVAHLGTFMARLDGAASDIRSRGGDLMITMVRGGDTPYVIPDSAECLVERRTVPGESSMSILAELDALIDSAWKVEIELLAHRESWQLDTTGPAAHWASALATSLEADETFAAPYWMEAPLWQAVCPTLICGPSGGGLHAIDEWVDLTQVRRFTTALTEVFSSMP